MHSKMPKAYLLHTSNIINIQHYHQLVQQINKISIQRTKTQAVHRKVLLPKSQQYFIGSKELAYTHLHPPYANRKAYCSFDDRNMHINTNGTCICLESGQFRPDPWAVIWAPKKCSHWRELLLMTLIPLTKTNLYIIS